MPEPNITRTPVVSFVVPCYRLAHLLPECIQSILSQNFSDFEVLVMDDCSPDNTAQVAASFADARISYIRNDCNLGHVRNYNKGIGMSRGKYVWLISADDYLRKPYVLQRYVEVMEKHPKVGYTFCAAVSVSNGQEIEVLGPATCGHRDRVFNGRTFLDKLLHWNVVPAPSAIARRECYEKMSFFPTDAVWAGVPVEMGWVGDWYLWCLFALSCDVAYFAEPMVCYRHHDLSMTTQLTCSQRLARCSAADIAVPWMIKERADELGLQRISKRCLLAAAHEYARHLASKHYRSSTSSMTVAEFEDSLCRSTGEESERNWIRAQVSAATGDIFYSRGDLSSAKKFYLSGLKKNPRMAKVYAKLFLLSLGKAGDYMRRV